ALHRLRLVDDQEQHEAREEGAADCDEQTLPGCQAGVSVLEVGEREPPHPSAPFPNSRFIRNSTLPSGVVRGSLTCTSLKSRDSAIFFRMVSTASNDAVLARKWTPSESIASSSTFMRGSVGACSEICRKNVDELDRTRRAEAQLLLLFLEFLDLLLEL